MTVAFNRIAQFRLLGIVSSVAVDGFRKRRTSGMRVAVGALSISIAATGLLTAPVSAAPVVSAVVPLVEQIPDPSEIDPGPLPQFSEPAFPTTRSTAAKAASQCQYGSFGTLSTDAADANNIMRGQARVTQFGTFSLKKNPSWRYTSSLDRSGNANMHALHWALPLLRYGLRTGNTAMVSRFYSLVFDWIKDNPPKRPRQSAAYGQIESGFRMLSMACALAGPAPKRKKLKAALKTQATVAAKRWGNVNNVSFLQAGGIFSAGCAIGSSKIRKKGLSRMAANSAKMIAEDGSVREGSMIYARNTYTWTQQQIARIRGCGSAVPAALLRSNAIPDFLAHGMRPDSRYEALGDGVPSKSKVDESPAGSSMRFMTAGGGEGAAPANKYSSYAAGFIFGHSGFGQNRPFVDETYYSIRSGPGHASEYHAHSDAAALTLASKGSQLLFDTGQYKYANDAASAFVYSRAAHNNVSIDGLSASAPRPLIVASQSTSDGDLTSLVDGAYAGSQLQRTVWYDRVGDYFIVMDDVSMDRVGTFNVNWNFGRDRTVVVDGQSASTNGPGANVTIMNVGNEVNYTVGSGERTPYRGWNSSKYGELVPSPTLRAHAWGPSNRIVSVIVPRSTGVGPEVASATGTITPTGAQVETTIGSDTYRIELSTAGAIRLPDEPVLP